MASGLNTPRRDKEQLASSAATWPGARRGSTSRSDGPGARLRLPGEPTGKGLGLKANIGDGDRFPKGGLAHRPDGENSFRSAPGRVDERAIVIDIEANAERIGARETLGDELSDDRVGAASRIASQSTAGDDTGDFQAGQSFGCARTDRNVRPLLFRVGLKQMARQDSQLAALLQRPDLRFDLGRHSVAVYVPPGARVFEKPSAGPVRHSAPDRLHMWAQTINDASPVSAALKFHSLL
jgi:hypothetical protein